MSKVLVTHSYFYKFDPKQWKFKQPYPPLGTMIAAAVIRQAGFEVSMFDSNLKDSAKEFSATFALTPNHVIDSVWEIFFIVVCCIRTANDHSAVRSFSRF